MKGLKSYEKTLGIKTVISGAEVTPDMLAKINRYALDPLTAEKVYVRKFLLAHNGIDRDRERFPEELLDDYARTLPGKSFLVGHSRPAPGKGLFFDAICTSLTLEKFKELTGEELKLPEGIDAAKVLWGWVYMLKAPFNEEMMANIDGGVYRHVSIGFNASNIIEIKDSEGNRLYWEYVAPGEAREGSIVWLGAQPGATAQKGAKACTNCKEKKEKKQKQSLTEGDKKMEKFLMALTGLLGKTCTEENAASEIKTLISEKNSRIETLEEKVKGLEPLAADGKSYRDNLVQDYVTLKAKLKEVAETDEAQKTVKSVAGGYPINFLKSEVNTLQKRVEDKFPTDSQLEGDDRRDKSADGHAEKDWKNAKDNSLIPEE